jgi:homocysteine S-methyltransferase
VTLLDALRQSVLVADGANGTLLAQRGYHRLPCDLANLDAPDLVRAVHLAYLEAGSDIIETNTYQANRFRLPEGTDLHTVNVRGAEIAQAAVRESRRQAYVLGAVGPAGKPVAPYGQVDAGAYQDSVTAQARALVEGGVDGFMLETFVDMHELELAIEAIRAVSDLPIIASKAYIEDGEMLTEGLPAKCAQEMAALGVAALGANCVVGPQRMLDVVRQLAEATDLPILAMPTPGFPQLVKGVIAYDATPDYFAKSMVRLAEEGARILGGCCGTTPEHIRALRELLDRQPIKVRQRTVGATATKERRPLPAPEPSQLAQKLGRQFVVAVEMDVPRGLNLGKLTEGCIALRNIGVDVINISDGARARLRMSPASVAAILQRDAEMDVTMHFACRDRNLLAIQSDLLGARALGVRNILAVTGDPANIGDYPSATSVFDIDSIGLCRILSRFNEGIDLAGYSIGMKCGFTIACAYNPLAMDPVAEFDRLQRKADAGAHVIYTQPVFDVAQAETCVRDAARVGLPVLVGVLPLKSARHAEFMHHEVPGISIPDTLRQRVASAASDDDALEIGIEAAQSLSAWIQRHAAGLYLMPPFGSALIAARVLGSGTSAVPPRDPVA